MEKPDVITGLGDYIDARGDVIEIFAQRGPWWIGQNKGYFDVTVWKYGSDGRWEGYLGNESTNDIVGRLGTVVHAMAGGEFLEPIAGVA